MTTIWTRLNGTNYWELKNTIMVLRCGSNRDREVTRSTFQMYVLWIYLAIVLRFAAGVNLSAEQEVRND